MTGYSIIIKDQTRGVGGPKTPESVTSLKDPANTAGDSGFF